MFDSTFCNFTSQVPSHQEAQAHLTVGALDTTCSLQGGLLLPPAAQLHRLQTRLLTTSDIFLRKICGLHYILFIKHPMNKTIPITMKDRILICVSFQSGSSLRYDLLQRKPRQGQISPQLSHLTQERVGGPADNKRTRQNNKRTRNVW